MFNSEQKKAIKEKIRWLEKLKGESSYEQLEKKIINIRLAWFEKKKDKLIEEINSKEFDSDIKKVYFLIFHQWLPDRFCQTEGNSSLLVYGKVTFLE